MSFFGHEFIFDGISCKQFGLQIYDFGSNTQSDTSFPSVGKAYEDRPLHRYSSLFYGISQNIPLEFNLVFGVNIDSVDLGKPMDRYEIDAITAWLTGHNTMKWLEVIQPDMEQFRYKCYISELKLITYGNLPWAFSCKVTCDSPFAYTYPEIFTRDPSEDTILIFNKSGYNGYYKPTIIIDSLPDDADERNLSIQNQSDNDRIFCFEDIPTEIDKITIDNENMTIIGETAGATSAINLYPYFNLNFFRLVRGVNKLKIEGDATVRIVCEFPVNIGG